MSGIYWDDLDISKIKTLRVLGIQLPDGSGYRFWRVARTSSEGIGIKIDSICASVDVNGMTLIYKFIPFNGTN